jgi:hypothetical protein
MRRIAILAVLLIGCFSATAALADSPHFIKKDTSATLSGDNLVVTFKLAGLGTDVSSVDVSVSADAACINGGGKKPKAANKTELSASGTFAVHNGSSSGSLTLSPAGKPELNCGAGQTLQYSNVVLSGAGGAATLSFPGTFP